MHGQDYTRNVCQDTVMSLTEVTDAFSGFNVGIFSEAVLVRYKFKLCITIFKLCIMIIPTKVYASCEFCSHTKLK